MRRRLLLQPTALAVLFAWSCLFLPGSPAVAGWVSTRHALEGPRAELASLIDREEIALGLRELGISPAEAKRRVAGLTDAEARDALGRLDTLPAGGNPVATVVTAGLVVFLVLLLTDILGFTDIFPFVKKTVR